jgi:hypothetical protein
MEEESIVEKKRREYLLKYLNQPEEIAFRATLNHYKTYVWGIKNAEYILGEHEVKSIIIDLWFENKCDLREEFEDKKRPIKPKGMPIEISDDDDEDECGACKTLIAETEEQRKEKLGHYVS